MRVRLPPDPPESDCDEVSMTVKQLIERLSELPQDHAVVVDYHSEYARAEKAELIVGVEQGGWISRVYRPQDKTRACGFVLIE